MTKVVRDLDMSKIIVREFRNSFTDWAAEERSPDHWRPIRTRYDRCARTFMFAICIAATVIFGLNP